MTELDTLIRAAHSKNCQMGLQAGEDDASLGIRLLRETGDENGGIVSSGRLLEVEALGAILRWVATAKKAESEFPTCVAVGDSNGRFSCSGILLNEVVVLTAGHCHARGLRSFVITEPEVEGAKRKYEVARSLRHRDFEGEPFFRSDIAVLWLEEPVDGPKEFPEIIDVTNARKANGVLMVGYGNRSSDGYGVRKDAKITMMADKHSTIPDFSGRPVRYDKSKEFVGVPVRGQSDACAGDSGGPAFVVLDGRLRLVGMVSRDAGMSKMACGGGTVYVALDAVKKWLDEVLYTGEQ